VITASGGGLSELLDEYYAALAAGDPGRLPLAADVRFTENGQEIAIGTGLWATATGTTASTADNRPVTVSEEAYGPGGTAGHAAGWGMVAEGGEGGQDALLGVRLKTTGRVISEIETLVVRRAPFGRDTFPASLRERSAAMAEVLEPAERGTREDLVKAANGYFDGVARDDADLIPAADDCVRVENGLRTVLNPDGAGFPATFVSSGGLGLGVRAQIRTRAFRHIEDIRDRRFTVADTERGLVLVCCFFDHPGQLRDAGFDSPIKTPNSMLIWELFKVAGGLIRRIEAIGAAFPYGMRAGWTGRS
jgi:hypothetical protein